MAGPLKGLHVVDLTYGIAGPVATMLLAESGATVTRIEPRSSAASGADSGAHVWHRDKRIVEVDLATEEGRGQVRSVAETADVFVESFPPGTTAKWGLDFASLEGINPGLVYCSITA